MTQHDYERTETSTGGLAQGTGAQTDEARRAAQGVAEHARGAVSDVTHEARQAAGTVKSEVAGLATTVKEQIASGVGAQKDSVAERLGAVAEHVRETADELRDREAWLAEVMDRGARELGGLADSLKRSDLPGMLTSVERFARRQPALFMGAAVALGFALTRIARSSAESGYDEGAYGQRYGEVGAGQGYGQAGAGGYAAPGTASGTGGYIDQSPERPDVGSAWPQAQSGLATSAAAAGQPGLGGSTYGSGSDVAADSRELQQQPGQGSTGQQQTTTGSYGQGSPSDTSRTGSDVVADSRELQEKSREEGQRQDSSGGTQGGTSAADLTRGSNV